MRFVVVVVVVVVVVAVVCACVCGRGGVGVRGGMGWVLDGFWVHRTARPSVCRRHGFRSVSQICFGISISCAFSLGLWAEPCLFLFSAVSLSKWLHGSHIGFFGFRTLSFSLTFHILVQTSVGNYLCIWKESYRFSALLLSKWLPGSHIGFLCFRTINPAWLWTSNPKFRSTLALCMSS